MAITYSITTNTPDALNPPTTWGVTQFRTATQIATYGDTIAIEGTLEIHDNLQKMTYPPGASGTWGWTVQGQDTDLSQSAVFYNVDIYKDNSGLHGSAGTIKNVTYNFNATGV